MTNKFEAMTDAVLKAKLLAKTTSDEDKAQISAILDFRAENPKPAKTAAPKKEVAKAEKPAKTAEEIAAAKAAAEAKKVEADKKAEERKAAKEAKAAEKEAARIAKVKAVEEAAQARAALRFPLVGTIATYKVNPRKEGDETVASGKVLGIVLDKRVSMFLVRIETPTGMTHKTISAIVAGEHPDTAAILKKYTDREMGLSASQKLADLDAKIAELTAEREKLAADAAAYAASDAAKEWEENEAKLEAERIARTEAAAKRKAEAKPAAATAPAKTAETAEEAAEGETVYVAPEEEAETAEQPVI